MILLFALFALAVIGFVVSFVFVHKPCSELAFVVALSCFVFATGASLGACVQQGEQKKIVELHGNLAQLLELIDTGENSALSARARGTLAPMIGKVNEAVAEAKEKNDGLLDIWYSDVLAASKPLR